ncbi:hypothetical protein KR032_007400 [Drosophila birchii]|nr:hypothetical protein KR032_007400 [Drosophila birchii]
MPQNIVCVIKNCQKNVLADQPSFHCWLCEAVVHAKCIEMTGRMADAVSSKKGLRYCCEACRPVEKEISSFMRQTRTSTLHSPVAAEQSTLSPMLTGPASTVQPAAPAEVLPSLIISSATPDSMELLPPPAPLTGMVPIMAAPVQGQPPPVPLTSMVPRKIIFVSRLNASATINDVSHHIITRLPSLPHPNFEITKFKFKQNRDYASFKINVPEGLFSKLLCPTFWPPNTVVHEFVIRKNKNLARSPSVLPNSASTSKN